MKKALSLFLSVVMLLSLFSCLSVVTFAGDIYLESVSFEAACESEAYEYTYGYWSSVYDEENGEQKNRFYYDNVLDTWADGNVITLEFSDGTSVEYTCQELYYYDEDGNVLDEDALCFYDSQESEPWEAGTNYITMEYDGVCTDIPVEIIESPVEAVEFVPVTEIELIQNADGEVLIHEMGPYEGEEYFSYSYNDFWANGNQIIVTYKDGTSETYECDGWDYYSDGNVIEWGYCNGYDTQDIKPWTETGEYAFSFYYMGCKAEVPVTVVENFVSSIEYVQADICTLIENYNGWYEYCECADCVADSEEYFYYALNDADFPCYNDTLIVTYTDGSVLEYIYDGEYFVDQNGEIMPCDFYLEDNQSEDHWESGIEYFDFCYLGKSVSVPVQIIENTIAAISVSSASPIEIYENTMGEWDYYYDEYFNEIEFYRYFCPIFTEGVSITVEYTDGTTEIYTYSQEDDWFIGEDGEKYLYGSVENSSNQYEGPWGLGEYSFTIEYMGQSCELPVTIVENPVKEIEFICAETPVFEYQVDGQWDELYDWETDEFYNAFIYDTYMYSPYSEGNKIIITYDTDVTETFTYSEYEGAFINENGEKLPSQYDVEYCDEQYNEPWTLASEANYIVVKFMGRFTTVRVVLDNGVAPEAAVITDCYNGNGSITVEWDYVNNATEYHVYKRVRPNGGNWANKWYYVGATTNNYIVDDSVNPYEYNLYYVHAENSGGTSAYVGSKALLTQYIPPVEIKVQNRDYGIVLDFTSTNDVVIYRRVEGETQWTYYGNVPGSKSFVYDPNVVCGKNYTYAAVVNYGNYTSAMSYSNTVTYLTSPKLTKVSNVADGIQVNWNAVTGADSYNIYRKTATTGWILLGTSNTNSFVDTTAKAGITYTYTARASANGCLGYFENGLSVKRISTPVITSAYNNTDCAFIIWGKIAEATEYRVYRKVGASGWVYLATTKNSYYADLSVKNASGYTYSYTVIAVSGKTFSGFDADGTAVKRLTTPVLKSAKNTENGVQVDWGAVLGANSYNVYRKTATTGWILLGTSSTTSYVDNTAQAGVVYTYTVRALSGGYISNFQSGISVKKITTPKITKIYNNTTGVFIMWDKIPEATEYRVYRKTATSGWVYMCTTKNPYCGDVAVKNASGNVYSYTVIAVNGKTFSGFDGNGTAITRLATPVLTSANNTEDGIQVNWNAVAGADGYNVYRKTATTGWILLGTSGENAYVDTTAEVGTTYTYTVRAYYGSDLSNFEPAGVTTQRV